MCTYRRFASALAFLLLALPLYARAQAPSIQVTTDDDAAQFSVQGQAQSVRVEVFAPSGELVFEGDGLSGQAVVWPMRDQKGAQVADGVYLATVTVTDSSGKRRKRIEQLTVNSEPQRVSAAVADAPAPQDSLAPTGAGTAGRIAKWTTSTNLGNSVVTESAGRVGVNVTPIATLQVNGPQPTALASNGAKAATLLQTSGGKGGDTTVGGGKVAGAGAGIALYAGAGGNAPAGSKNGGGGSVVLQAGSAGSGTGTAGANGNVLINPTGVGNVGVGTSSATSRLTVNGRVQTLGAGNGLTLGAGGSIKFADGSVQTTAVLPAVQHDATLVGAGTPASPLGLAAPLALSGSTPDTPTLWAVNTGGGNGIIGQTTSATNAAIYGSNTAVSGKAVWGNSPAGIGVMGQSVSGHGVYGYSASSNSSIPPFRAGVYGEGRGWSAGVYGTGERVGVRGESDNVGVSGVGTYGSGVSGVSKSTSTDETSAAVYGYNQSGGWAGYFFGPVQVNGTFVNNSDRNAKANITSIDPRSILLKLAAVPVQAWNYKTEGPSIRHLGPMAQDFRAAFGFGVDEKGISGVDADGVALASIQALYHLMQEKDKQIERQSSQVAEQARQIRQLQAQLDQLKRAVSRRRALRR